MTVTSAPIDRVGGRAPSGLLPPPGPLRSFAFVTLVDSVGLGLYSTGSVLFFTRILHLTTTFVGLGLTVAAAVGLLASIPAGRIADRTGGRRVLVPVYAAQALLFALLTQVEGRTSFLLVVTGISLAETAGRPVRRAALSNLVNGEAKIRASAYNRSVLNVGFSVGALGAGAALAVGSRDAYDLLILGNAVSFVVAGVLFARLPLRAPLPMAPTRSAEPTGDRHDIPRVRRRSLMRPRIILAATVCGILCSSSDLLDVAMPLQVSRHTTAPTWTVAALLLVNTFLAVTLQVRASRGSEDVAGASRANRRAGLSLVGACVLLPLAVLPGTGGAVVVLLGASILLSGGELWSSAGAWGMSYAMAPEERHTEFLAGFALVQALPGVAGPALAALVVASGPWAWAAAGAVFLGAGLVAPTVSRQSART